MIVYVLTENEANEGGTVVGVYSSERKAREEIGRRGPLAGVFYRELLRVEVDGSPGEPTTIRLD